MRIWLIVLLLVWVAGAGCSPPAPATVAPARTPTQPAATEAPPTVPATATPGGPAEPAETIPATVVKPMTPGPSPSPESPSHGPQLIMVVIRARSSREVQQLRGMDLGIAKVRPDPSRPPSDKSLSGGYIVEAVVTPGQLSKLEALGFDVSEVPR
jgi:hypothetical protein